MPSNTPAFPTAAPSANPDGSRYAIYFAPDAGSALHEFGAHWLGRDAIAGTDVPRPALDGFTAEQQAELTRTANSYGFHATLKPPFHLSEGYTVDQLLAEAELFAAARHPFFIELVLRDLSGFLALMQKESKAEMRELAADCVRHFDPFRALPNDAELEKRREAGLSAQQEAMLQRWGYPYVMGEFRFHMTLSKRIKDDSEREALMREVLRLGEDALSAPVSIDSVSIFRQSDRKAPFTRLARFPFRSCA